MTESNTGNPRARTLRPRASARCTGAALIMLAMAALLPAPGRAQNPGQNGFRMSLLPDRTEYWVGEPIVLRCRVTNWFSPSLRMQSTFGLMHGGTELRIVHEHEPGEPYHAYYRESPTTPIPLLIRYGKSYEHLMSVLYDPEETESHLAIPAPGEYSFLARQTLHYVDEYVPFAGQQSQIALAVSPAVQVVPPPEAHAPALAFLREHPQVILDMNRQVAGIGNLANLRRIVNEHPDSRYAPWCLHAIANYYLLLSSNDWSAFAKAEEHFGRLVRSYPDYPLRDEARASLATVCASLYKLNETRDIVTSLIEEDEDNLFRFRANPVVRPLRGPVPNPLSAINEQAWELFDTTELINAYVQGLVEAQG